jgi:hypothetical protein
MSTDEMVQEHIDNPKIPEFGAQIPFEQPQPAPQPVSIKRRSSIFDRLRQKKAKALNLQRAVEFAGLALSAGTRAWVTAKSLVEVHGLKTRQARAIVKQQKPRKHRTRA